MTEDPICTDCWGTGVTDQTERRCACQPPIMAEVIKPCPFCGGSDIRFDAHPHAGTGLHRGETVYSMCCYECGATFPNRYRKELLADAWNRRSPANALLIESLTKALEWYANPEIYKPHPHGLAFDDRDLSFAARTALAQARKG